MADAVDLTGRTYGKLKVLPRTKNQNNGKVYALCECECGNRARYKIEWLKSGLVKSCISCRTPYVDITGLQVGLLTAICPTERRDSDGSIMWKCQCDCGEFTYRSYGKLKRSNEENTSFSALYYLHDIQKRLTAQRSPPFVSC